MKNFLFLLSLIFGSTFCLGQTTTIDNLSNCDVFVVLYEFDANCLTTTQTIFLAAGATTTASPVAGGNFEVAVISDSFPATAGCYQVKVQVAWATCVTGIPLSNTSSTCCPASATITSDFNSGTSSVATPYLLIN
jgi:hypothetical protein